MDTQRTRWASRLAAVGGGGGGGSLAPFPEGPAGPQERGNRTSPLFSKQVVLCELKVSTRWAEMMKEASA